MSQDTLAIWLTTEKDYVAVDICIVWYAFLTSIKKVWCTVLTGMAILTIGDVLDFPFIRVLYITLTYIVFFTVTTEEQNAVVITRH